MLVGLLEEWRQQLAAATVDVKKKTASWIHGTSFRYVSITYENSLILAHPRLTPASRGVSDSGSSLWWAWYVRLSEQTECLSIASGGSVCLSLPRVADTLFRLSCLSFASLFALFGSSTCSMRPRSLLSLLLFCPLEIQPPQPPPLPTATRC